MGLLLAWRIWPREQQFNLALRENERAFGAFLKIATDGTVTVAVPQAEMGQGIWTALPQVLADALGARWQNIAVEPAPIGPDYANKALIAELEALVVPQWGRGAERMFRSWPTWVNQLQATPGMGSVTSFHQAFAQAGAVARTLLCMAAAKRWETDWHRLVTREGYVINGAERFHFGALAEEAALLKPPATLLEAESEKGSARLIGRSLPRLDAPPKLDGTARFGGDIRLPEMLFASVRAGPVGESVLKSADIKAGEALRGVEHVIRRDDWVAVVAQNWWTANRALNLIKPVFETRGVIRNMDTIDAVLTDALATSSQTAVAVAEGDLLEAFKGKTLFTAEYDAPLLAASPMETPGATARIAEDGCEIWIATQSSTLVREAVAAALGLAPQSVTVYPTLVGGGFGVMMDPAPAVQAALIAREVGRPVQLVWSRFEEQVHSIVRPPMRARMRATLTADNKIAAWQAAIAAPDLASARGRALLPDVKIASKPRAAAIEGANIPYAIEVQHIAHHLAEMSLPMGVWRGGAHGATAFFTECFVDELAAVAKVDPLEFRLNMLAGQPRLARVLKMATQRGGYALDGQDVAQGLAVHNQSGSAIAAMAEVSVADGGKIKIKRLVAAVDCGKVINPALVRQQIENGIIFALDGVLRGGIGWESGLPVPVGLGKRQLPLMKDQPEIEVYLVDSRDPSVSVSAASVAVVAPAVANAIYAATGDRVRHLPITGLNGS